MENRPIIDINIAEFLQTGGEVEEIYYTPAEKQLLTDRCIARLEEIIRVQSEQVATTCATGSAAEALANRLARAGDRELQRLVALHKEQNGVFNTFYRENWSRNLAENNIDKFVNQAIVKIEMAMRSALAETIVAENKFKQARAAGNMEQMFTDPQSENDEEHTTVTEIDQKLATVLLRESHTIAQDLQRDTTGFPDIAQELYAHAQEQWSAIRVSTLRKIMQAEFTNMPVLTVYEEARRFLLERIHEKASELMTVWKLDGGSTTSPPA